MAFNINPGKQQFSATAAQTVFTFNFAIFADTDLKVYKTLAGAVANDTTDLLTLSTHYTVSINGTLGGTVTLLSGASLNDTITVVRSLPIARTTDYVTNGDLYAEILDLDQDYQTYLVLDQNVQLERAIIVPESLASIDLNIPAPVANSYLRWNATADALENDTSIPDDVVTTTANVALTNADVISTHADVIAASASATSSQLRAWEAEAEKLTADSYATEPENVFVKTYVSDGDGTFTATNTSEYSALHWSSKALINANFAPSINAATAKTTPVDADLIGLVDSADSFALKKLTWANIKTTLGLLFAPIASPNFTGDVSINGVNVGVYPYRNRIINGAMNVNQMNGTTAVTPTTGSYFSDQWYSNNTQASKLTLQQVADAPSGFKNSTKITVASQYSPLSTDNFMLYQVIEGQNIIDFQFGTAGAVTINTSLNIKGSIAGTYSVSVRSSNVDRSYVGTITVGTSWSKVAINLVGANDGTWNKDNTSGLYVGIDLGSGSNFNTTAGAWQTGNFTRTSGSVTFVNQVAGSTLNITGVQLEKVPTGATQGTEYEWLPIEEELRRCKRYYEKISYINGSEICLVSFYNTTTAVSNAINFSNKRVFGTIIVSNIAHFEARSSASDALSLATIAGISSSLDSAYLGFSVSVATTAGTVGRLRAINSLAYIAISAQL